MAATGGETALNLPGPERRDRGLLLDVMQTIPDEWLDDPSRWPLGVNWLPWGVDGVTTAPADCDVEYDKQPGSLPNVVIQPAFLIYKHLQCSTLGPVNLLAERVFEKLDLATSAGFAAELELAAQSGGVGLVGNATYVPAVDSSLAVSLARGFADLETHLADVLDGGEGVIHLTAGLLTIALAESLVEWRDGAYRTATGHRVVGDAGHDGTTGPEGESDAADGQAWIYATGPLFHRVQPIDGVGLDGDEAADGNSQIYVARNKRRPLGERHGVIAFDPNTLGAALVTIGTSGGGGGGAGDASAANQATMISRLDDVIENTEPQAATSAVSRVNDSASSVTLAAANTDRRALTIFNDSDEILYVKLGATASTTDFTVKVQPDGYYELPQPAYTGVVDGIWASDSSGAAQVTEID